MATNEFSQKIRAIKIMENPIMIKNRGDQRAMDVSLFEVKS